MRRNSLRGKFESGLIEKKRCESFITHPLPKIQSLRETQQRHCGFLPSFNVMPAQVKGNLPLSALYSCRSCLLFEGSFLISKRWKPVSWRSFTCEAAFCSCSANLHFLILLWKVGKWDLSKNIAFIVFAIPKEACVDGLSALVNIDSSIEPKIGPAAPLTSKSSAPGPL